MDEQCVESSAGHVMEVFRKRMRIAARAQMRSSSSIRMDGHRQTHALFKDDDASCVTNRSPAPSRCCATARVAVAGALLLELVPRSRTAGLRADDDARLPALGLSGYA
jgi:hypothetical protein